MSPGAGRWIEITFAVIWASFGILHRARIKEISSHEGMTEFDERWDFRVGLVLGPLAGATVLLCRADLKIAIPSSVVIMGFTSLLGIVVKNLTTGLQPSVYENWLAAAPVVALGAPLGMLVVN